MSTINTPLPASDGSASTMSAWETWSRAAQEAFWVTDPPSDDQAAREEALEAFLVSEYPGAQVFIASWVPTAAHGHVTLPQWACDYMQHGTR